MLQGKKKRNPAKRSNREMVAGRKVVGHFIGHEHRRPPVLPEDLTDQNRELYESVAKHLESQGAGVSSRTRKSYLKWLVRFLAWADKRNLVGHSIGSDSQQSWLDSEYPAFPDLSDLKDGGEITLKHYYSEASRAQAIYASNYCLDFLRRMKLISRKYRRLDIRHSREASRGARLQSERPDFIFDRLRDIRQLSADNPENAITIRGGCFIALLILVGMRASEVIGLEVENLRVLDNGNRIIEFRRKGGKEAAIELAAGDPVIAHIDQWIAVREKAAESKDYCQMNHAAKHWLHNPFLFPGRGKRVGINNDDEKTPSYSPKSLTYEVLHRQFREELASLISVRFGHQQAQRLLLYWTPHRCRHYFATYLLNECGEPVSRVAELMGHCSYNTTQRYVDPNTGQGAKTISRISALAADATP